MNQKTETTTLIEVYDPVMCCSTGVCGPNVDDTLADFANDVKWLKSQGVEIKRFNLGQEPEAFKANSQVLARLRQAGTETLPIILVNGEMVSEGSYPDRNSLMNWAGIQSTDVSDNAEQGTISEIPIYSEKIDVLVAIGSAVASGCESCLKAHFAKGKRMGISKDDMASAMQTGLNIRQVPMSQIVDLANKLLGVKPMPSNGCAPSSGCC
jgi:AhpD family alkylhydroperoxidase